MEAVIEKSDITIKRLGIEILPKFKDIFVGMRDTKDIKQDESIKWENFK